MRFFFCSLAIIGLVMNCTPGSGNKAYEKLDHTTQIIFDKYMIQGKELYQQHCTNCHQSFGEGVRRLVPSLVQNISIDQPAVMACLIKTGTSTSRRAPRDNNPLKMPGNQKLTYLEIAELITYISNSWGNEYGLIQPTSVEKWLNNCSGLD